MRDNPKVFWQHINRKRKNKQTIDCLVDKGANEDRLITNNLDKANCLGSFFSSVYIVDVDNEGMVPDVDILPDMENDMCKGSTTVPNNKSYNRSRNVAMTANVDTGCHVIFGASGGGLVDCRRVVTSPLLKCRVVC
ncbi:hypothetical protein HELRODRAFT_175802 [Helobdella robusta]|uniref:Uncharacterized protein n=1 Tax=Helobdella robusta TaxID=6412 RepID=T1F9N8_HELRO|nr:hypothetical protein HELRODRAFT_175802 [Helobdella robusta]ESO00385.1 hypothetical protein HELRODRAFT_175802 [Helobdella robusta]